MNMTGFGGLRVSPSLLQDLLCITIPSILLAVLNSVRWPHLTKPLRAGIYFSSVTDLTYADTYKS